ncbi:MAG: methyltransferase domain-containing protein [Candidatus Omnitrophica bacterium]|nr:methyltransferase domain-containing protein [Candidatus Omnitrophota bacterium]
MFHETLFLIQTLGLKTNLENLKAMQSAKSPIRGYLMTLSLWALDETGFLGELAAQKSVSPGLFSERKKIDPAILKFLTGYLTQLGMLEMENEKIRFTKKGEKFWKKTCGVFQIFSAYQPFFHHLASLLRKETSLEKLARNDLAVARGFRQTGSVFIFPIMEKLLRELSPGGPRGLIELGCGNMDLSSFLAGRHPEMRFLGIDYDKRFLEGARATLENGPLDGRVRLLEGNIFDIGPRDFKNIDLTLYDLVTAIDLFHGYFDGGPDILLKLFKKLKGVFQGKKFLFSEVCLPDEKRMKELAYPHVEHELFHHLTKQKTFRRGELEALLEESGFRIEKTWSVRNLAARIFVLCS